MQNLDQFIKNFWGYGSWKSPVWFVGLEEAGSDGPADLELRLKVWKSLGSPDLLDCKKFHLALAKSYEDPQKSAAFRGRFDGEITTQQTWARLICLYLAYKSETDKINTLGIQEFQRDRLNELTLIEFLPLPVSGTGLWPYAKVRLKDPEMSDILGTRRLYRGALGPRRARELKSKISEKKPECVVVYGKSDLVKLLEIDPSSVKKHADFEIMKIGKTTLINLPHPTARGKNSYADWAKIGEMIKRAI